MQAIIENEGKHFTLKRTGKFLVTLIFLFVVSMFLGNNYQAEPLVSKSIAYISVVVFALFCLTLSYINVKEIKTIHDVKRQFAYRYDATDITFDDKASLYRVIIICFIAGCLGGIVGIAGGIILAPLFLQLGMLPVVVAATNQYLAMISTISVSAQFVYLRVVNWHYTLLLVSVTSVAAYIGILYANRIVKLTGR